MATEPTLREMATRAWQDQTSQLGRLPKQAAPSFKPDVYANRVVVERHEHDATLKFFRDGESTGRQVGEVTVPLGVLEALKDKSD